MSSSRRSLLNIIYRRRSIRRFRTSEVSDEVVELIVEAGQRAPSYLQAYCLILVRDEAKRQALARICGDQFMGNAPVWILACLDLNRTVRMLDSQGHDHVFLSEHFMPEFILGIFDTAVAVENMVIASEVLGLGSLIVSDVLYNCEDVSRIIGLPARVIPLVLLCIGEKGEDPPERPRWPLHALFHKDSYGETSREEIFAYLREADKQLRSEGYFRKYAKRDFSYSEYIRQRTLKTKETVEAAKILSNFVRRIGLRI